MPKTDVPKSRSTKSKSRGKSTAKQLRIPLSRMRAIRGEVKAHDYGSFDQSLTAATAALWPITVPGLGTSTNQRIGRRCNPYALQVRVCCYQDTAGTISNIRCILTRDKANNGVLTPYSSIVATPAEILSPRNQNYLDRIDVLRDSIQVGIANQNNKVFYVDWYVDLRDAPPLEFIGDTADTAASLGCNGYFLYLISDTSISYSMATNNARAGFDMYTRFLFHDN